MILTITNYILECLATFYFMISVNGVFTLDKYDKKTKIILPLCCSIMFLSYLVPKNLFPLNTLLTMCMYTLIVHFVLKIKILKSILQGLAYVIFTFLVELTSITILSSILGENIVQEFDTSFTKQMLFLFTYFGIGFLISTIIGFVLSKNPKFYNMLKFFKSKQFIGLIIIMILTIIPGCMLMVYNKYYYNYSFLFFNIIQIVVILIYTLYSIYTYLEKEKFKEENIELQTDNKAMISLIDGVRTVKHDFNNIFQAIHGYLCVKDYDKLESYVDSVMKECNMLNNITFLNKEVFDEPGVYGVVGSKQFYANSINITFDIDVTSKISSISFEKNQLSRILGIILDNAIEATNKTKDKYVKLEIHFDKKKNANIIRVSNTYDTSISIDLTKIYDKGYSSKKVKSGIGLWEVKRLVTNNKKSQIYATIENNLFVQNIIIED